MEKQNCGNCRKAVFEHTPSGRIKATVSGRCTHKVEWPAVPFFLTSSFPPGYNKVLGQWMQGIWTDTGEGCACWEAKQ